MSSTSFDDALIRAAAFQHVRRLQETHDALTSDHLKAGFSFQGERLPLINPQRGIFKPRQMRFLLSIRTVYPRPGARVWYDDQRQVHQQVYEGDQTVDYAFMGDDPEVADNRWLREAFETQTPLIYFLGTSPGRYHAITPAFVAGWDRLAGVAPLPWSI
jgi:putative restriction endonuclease